MPWVRGGVQGLVTLPGGRGEGKGESAIIPATGFQGGPIRAHRLRRDFGAPYGGHDFWNFQVALETQ